ncbi:hypothetical protein M422DRAFT_264034 [Sphaerobolus stellatus SS14]|uniref:Uncharacterized protein n=1 Tax=Sphaerobolus stellatus (strain SS14) TaxID=990650 RepID=A0A0C9UXC3_SPHS4|nr:hypothetical protein M422DRAFT_264034 [Sphaerobolus stellatus SS14]
MGHNITPWQPNVNHANNILETRHSCPAKHPPRQAWDPPSFPGLAEQVHPVEEQVQLLEAPEILPPPTYQLRRRHLPEYLPGLLASAHPQPRNSIRLARALPPSLLSAICEWDGRMDGSSSTSTSDDGAEPDTALSASGSVAAAGWSHYPNKPIPVSTQVCPGPRSPGYSSGTLHNTNTVMSAPGSTSEGSGCWDGSFEGASDADTKAAASNPADMKTTNT